MTNADVEIERLLLARIELPAFHPEGPGPCEIYGFLVRDSEHCILVDTGIGTDNALIDRLYEPRRVELATALDNVGASLGAVTAIVNSHLHFDHCGNNSRFPGVPIFVQRAELDAATTPDYTVPAWIDFPGAHYVPVDGRRSISPNLELVPTPGHTPGHQSLLARSGNRVEMIVAQAAYTADEFQRFQARRAEGVDALEDETLEPFIRSNASWRREEYVRSLATIQRERPNRAWFSHDPVTWENDGPSPA